MIEIDGSYGEGGGQIIRSSLALSAVTAKPFRIVNMRAGRKKPGLLRQHLTCVNAAREICDAGVTGNELGSKEVTFAPGKIQTRGFKFRIDSAGSTTLVAQTVLPALMLASGSSSIEIEGGTHNMAAPPFDFLERVYLPLVEKMGPQFTASIEGYGFYPAGGGKIRIEIEPTQSLKPLVLENRGKLEHVDVTALVSQLPASIGERECDLIRRKSNWHHTSYNVKQIDSPGPGNVVMIELASENTTEIFTGFGKRGVKAEDVARRTYRAAQSYLDLQVPVGEHLTDQLLMPMGLAALHGETSRIRTAHLTQHSLTHIEILKQFLEINIEIAETNDGTTEITTLPLMELPASA